VFVRKFRAVNIGPFTDLSVSLTRGAVGVFGPNGSGKSTFVNLIYGAITNDFGRFAGVKADMVRNTADPKAESYVRVEVEHNGAVLDITRNLRPTRTRPGTVVSVGAEPPLTDANKAQAKIWEVLGVEGRLLDLYVFKTQDRIYDFLTSTPADRAKAYAALCRTEACEAAWTMFGEFLNKDRELLAEVVDNSDELAQRIAELKEEQTAMAERRATAAAKLCEKKFHDQYAKRVAAAERKADLEAQHERLVGLVRAAAHTAIRAAERATEADRLAAEAREARDARREDADNARAALKAVEAYAAYAARRKRLKKEADELAAEEQRTPVPQVPDGVEEHEKLVQAKFAAEKALESADELIRTFGGTGMTRCPTCTTPVSALDGVLDDAQAKAVRLPGEIRQLTAQIAAIERYKSEDRRYETWKTGFKARRKANRDAQAALTEITAPADDPAGLAAVVEGFKSLERAVEAAEGAARAAAGPAAKARAEHAAKKAQRDDVRAAADAFEVEPEKLEKARRRLAEHAAALTEVARLDGEATGLARELAGAERDLKAVRTKLARTRRVRAMARVVAEAREVVHRDRLPRRVAAANLARMEGDVNDNLAAFGDPFWVETDEELSFVAHKPGEPPQAAARLSTGQRVVLALAFWPAVSALWASELGLLTLDEPTANLDAENRKLLRDALAGMATKVRGATQLIMVTHDPDLRTAFDQVVDVG